MEDVQEIIDAVNGVGVAADEHDWDRILSLMTEIVSIDYSSLSGVPVETLPAKEVVARWKAFLPGFDATQHFITNHKVNVLSDHEATCFSYVQALHYLAEPVSSEQSGAGGSLWTVCGKYHHHFVRMDGKWITDQMTFTKTIVTGNMDLPKLAGERMQKKE